MDLCKNATIPLKRTTTKTNFDVAGIKIILFCDKKNLLKKLKKICRVDGCLSPILASELKKSPILEKKQLWKKSLDMFRASVRPNNFRFESFFVFVSSCEKLKRQVEADFMIDRSAEPKVFLFSSRRSNSFNSNP